MTNTLNALKKVDPKFFYNKLGALTDRVRHNIFHGYRKGKTISILIFENTIWLALENFLWSIWHSGGLFRAVYITPNFVVRNRFFFFLLHSNSHTSSAESFFLFLMRLFLKFNIRTIIYFGISKFSTTDLEVLGRVNFSSANSLSNQTFSSVQVGIEQLLGRWPSSSMGYLRSWKLV